MKRICNVILVLILVGIFFFWNGSEYGDTRVNHETITFVRAKVLKVLEDHREEKYPNLYVGSQRILVEMEGEKYTEPLEIVNILSTESSVPVEAGDRIIVTADEPEGIEPYYTVYNYDRSMPLVLILILFLTLLYLVGRKQGMLSIFALLVSVYIIFCLMIPAIYMGASPILMAVLTCILCSVYSTLILYGYTTLSKINLLAVTGAFLVGAGIFLFVSRLLHLSGYQMTDVEGLLLIADDTGMQLTGLLFVGVAVAAYGAAKDVSVSISSALEEIAEVDPNADRHSLFMAGMRMGRNIIGTMVDTLFFAFLGGSLTTILIYISYGVGPRQIINSNLLAVEFTMSIVSTAVLIVLVPITSYISARYYGNKNILH